ncbi:hypothetical protein [Pseudomonas sp. NPDC089569]|uniref:hypothetical protein n=1 Tax=Pseudomonas sp. NPDC089569 TaxID=3390722 RepID=UPI003D03706A
MQQEKYWVIKKPDGGLVQSFAIDPSATTVGMLLPDTPIKTKEGKNGPLRFSEESKAQALLAALTILVSTEYADAAVVNIESTTIANQGDKCPRCGNPLKPGEALFSTTMNRPDAAWESEGAPTLQDCQKCHSCGYSETLPAKV